jgi:hypothetical protein
MMMKKVFLLLFVLLPSMLEAQTLQPEGTSAEDVLPKGWMSSHAYGDLNNDGDVDVFDLALMKRIVLDGAVYMPADVNDDHQINVLDLIFMTEYLHGGERGMIGYPISVIAQ